MLKRKYLSFKRSFLPRFFTSKNMISLLMIDGIKIGLNTEFYDASSIIIDSTRPELIEIGSYCKITHGTTILTHDYSRSVLRRVYGQIIAEASKTIIGDNVFIGINSIILMGTKISDNTIIGAGSVVSGSFPENVVLSGNPAKIIMTLEEFHEKRLIKSKNEACNFYLYFIEYHKRKPSIHEMGHFFTLFLNRSKESLKSNNISLKLGGDDEQDILDKFLGSTPEFVDYEHFCEFCTDIYNQKENEKEQLKRKIIK